MSHRVVEFIALIVLAVYPSIPVVLIVAHRFIKLWRRIGRISFIGFLLLFAVLISGSSWLVVRYLGAILEWRLYDAPWALLGIMILVGAFVLGFKTVRTLSLRTLVGIPEIVSAEAEHQELVVNGAYQFVRHPRYLEFILELLGIAMLSGLVVNYILLIAFVPLIVVAAKLEERELAARFGEKYLAYKKSVGMFIPKLS